MSLWAPSFTPQGRVPFAALFPPRRGPAEPSLTQRSRPWLGTYAEIAADHAPALPAGFAAISVVHWLMSRQDPQSELSRLNREGAAGWVALHPWTEAVLRRALFWAEESGGAFDPAVRGGRWRDVEVEAGRARLARPCSLSLDGIAKGFAVDRAVDAMKAAGATCGLVNAGGDLRGFGARKWAVEVVDPVTRRPARRLSLRDQAAATSGVLPHDDGRERLPGRAPGMLSATVVAPEAMDADALTKVALADSPRLSRCLRLAGARTLRLALRGGRSRWSGQ